MSRVFLRFSLIAYSCSRVSVKSLERVSTIVALLNVRVLYTLETRIVEKILLRLSVLVTAI